MTEYRVEKSGGIYRITCKNHTRSDICKAVSALMITLVNTLECEREDMRLKELTCEVQEGSVLIKAEPYRRHRKTIEAQVRTVTVGMLTLEETFPEYVRCSVGEKYKKR